MNLYMHAYYGTYTLTNFIYTENVTTSITHSVFVEETTMYTYIPKIHVHVHTCKNVDACMYALPEYIHVHKKSYHGFSRDVCIP